MGKSGKIFCLSETATISRPSVCLNKNSAIRTQNKHRTEAKHCQTNRGTAQTKQKKKLLYSDRTETKTNIENPRKKYPKKTLREKKVQDRMKQRQSIMGIKNNTQNGDKTEVKQTQNRGTPEIQYKGCG